MSTYIQITKHIDRKNPNTTNNKILELVFLVFNF